MQPLSTRNGWDQGRGIFATPVSDHRNVLMLETGEAKFIDVPRGASYASFGFSDDTWVVYLPADAPPTIAEVTSDITDGSAPDFNPTLRLLDEGTKKIGFLTDADDAIVQVSFFG